MHAERSTFERAVQLRNALAPILVSVDGSFTEIMPSLLEKEPSLTERSCVQPERSTFVSLQVAKAYSPISLRLAGNLTSARAVAQKAWSPIVLSPVHAARSAFERFVQP